MIEPGFSGCQGKKPADPYGAAGARRGSSIDKGFAFGLEYAGIPGRCLAAKAPALGAGYRRFKSARPEARANERAGDHSSTG